MDQFQQKRIIRANRQDAMKLGVVGLVDLGSSKITSIVMSFNSTSGRLDSNYNALSACRVIGYSSTPSKGVFYGEMKNQELLTDAISEVLVKAQRIAQERVDYVFVSTSGGMPNTSPCYGTTELKDDTVQNEDISRALLACDIPKLDSDREYLHAHPINFSVDHRSGFHDPRGECGNRLSVDLQLLSVNSSTTNGLIGVIESCKSKVAGIVSSPYVSGLSTLIPQEQESGAACVDIGSDTIGISIFYKKHMIYSSVIRSGGNLITKDIATAFGISEKDAEQLKILHGGVVTTSQDDSYYCEINKSDGRTDKITRTELTGVIRPRAEEILEDIELELENAGFSSVPGQSIVLTGGCVHLLALESLAKEILGRRVRLGRPIRLSGLPQAMSGPGYSSVVGLCLHAAEPQDEIWDFENLDYPPLVSSIERTIDWLRKNF